MESRFPEPESVRRELSNDATRSPDKIARKLVQLKRVSESVSVGLVVVTGWTY